MAGQGTHKWGVSSSPLHSCCKENTSKAQFWHAWCKQNSCLTAVGWDSPPPLTNRPQFYLSLNLSQMCFCFFCLGGWALFQACWDHFTFREFISDEALSRNQSFAFQHFIQIEIQRPSSFFIFTFFFALRAFFFLQKIALQPEYPDNLKLHTPLFKHQIVFSVMAW